mmetsp:Transcript_36723/g.67211  ORF Transcript_36723/g.67211 Transcript_36723/m.67211 type:complete len:310 (+) Transcript_36723:43-972(+)
MMPVNQSSMLEDNFQYSLGPPDSGFSLFLAERTKKVHFIRHAEGFHNVETTKTGTTECLERGANQATEHPLWDSRLTEKGIEQAQALKGHLERRPSGGRSFTAFDLVVVSPLTRTLETAQHIFGPARKPGMPAFMFKGEAPPPRILVREECRERWGKYVCDGRRPMREIIPEFPLFDFSEVEYDEDVFFTQDEREPEAHTCARAVQFLEWLNKRPEKCIAVVTHSSFLRHLFMQFGADKSTSDKDTIQRLAGNCELRSVVMCSHGVKDARTLKPMTPHAANSTVTMATDGGGRSGAGADGGSVLGNAPP